MVNIKQYWNILKLRIYIYILKYVIPIGFIFWPPEPSPKPPGEDLALAQLGSTEVLKTVSSLHACRIFRFLARFWGLGTNPNQATGAKFTGSSPVKLRNHMNCFDIYIYIYSSEQNQFIDFFVSVPKWWTLKRQDLRRPRMGDVRNCKSHFPCTALKTTKALPTLPLQNYHETCSLASSTGTRVLIRFYQGNHGRPWASKNQTIFFDPHLSPRPPVPNK